MNRHTLYTDTLTGSTDRLDQLTGRQPRRVTDEGIDHHPGMSGRQMFGVSGQDHCPLTVHQPISQSLEQAGETSPQVMGQRQFGLGGPPCPTQRRPDLQAGTRVRILDVF